MLLKFKTLTFILSTSTMLNAELKFCHFDPEPSPGDSILPRDQFTWLAVLEYLRLEDGRRYDDSVPRVSIVHPQFALTTASVASAVPQGYGLGNVVLIEYVRDEANCGLTIKDVRENQKCPRSSYVMPVADVVLHPEYASFGAPDSVALIKLMRRIESQYLMPVCLPLEEAWDADLKVKKVWMIDYLSSAPKEYEYESKASKRLHILPNGDCDSFQQKMNVSITWSSRTLCSTGCGMRAGAPLVAHDNRGRMGYYWNLVGIALGDSRCHHHSERDRRNEKPPRYMYVWPYVDWITQVIMTDIFPFPMPSQQRLVFHISPEETNTDHKWEGRWYVYGKHCWRNKEYTQTSYLIYRDKFAIRTGMKTFLRYFLNLKTAPQYEITCIKVHMPNQMQSPIVRTPSYNSSVIIPLAAFTRRYDLRIMAWCHKSSEENLKKYIEEIKKIKAEAGKKSKSEEEEDGE